VFQRRGEVGGAYGLTGENRDVYKGLLGNLKEYFCDRRKGNIKMDV